MKKYEFTDEVKNIDGKTLHRIRAVRDIPEHDIKAGDLGGWLEKGGEPVTIRLGMGG